MESRDGDDPVDLQLIAAISLPHDSKVPDPHDGRSTPEEYDLYFQIKHRNLSLIEWTRTCVETLDAQFEDLFSSSSLSLEQKCQMLKGLLLIHQVTLRKWLASGEASQKVGEA